MEYLTAVNIATGIIVLLMLGCVIKLFAGDLGTNKTFYLIAFIALGVGLYLWRSGAAVDLFSTIFGSLQ
jgi:hypothetical protein